MCQTSSERAPNKPSGRWTGPQTGAEWVPNRALKTSVAWVLNKCANECWMNVQMSTEWVPNERQMSAFWAISQLSVIWLNWFILHRQNHSWTHNMLFLKFRRMNLLKYVHRLSNKKEVMKVIYCHFTTPKYVGWDLTYPPESGIKFFRGWGKMAYGTSGPGCGRKSIIVTFSLKVLLFFTFY